MKALNGKMNLKERMRRWLAAGWPLLLGIVLRIVHSVLTGLWFPPAETYDDVLMVEYAALRHHFTEPNMVSLAKYMGYPVLLVLTRLSKLPLTVVLGMIWSASALILFRLTKEVSGRKGISLFVFFYTLFLPVAFEMMSGTRMYRNQVLAPLTIQTLGLMSLLLLRICRREPGKRLVFPSAALALVFSFTFYVKEDGIWLLACLLFMVLTAAVILIVRTVREKKSGAGEKRFSVKRAFWPVLAVLFPVLFWAAVTAGYKAVNAHFFGVAETETRTKAETGRFVQLLYRIESGDRTGKIWLPADAFEQAVGVSGTLKASPRFTEAMMTNPFSSGDFRRSPLPGDIPTWVIRFSANEMFETWDEQAVQDFFGTVNREIEEAFADGSLQKTHLIQFLPSCGGLTLSEVGEVFLYTLESFESSLWMKGYRSELLLGQEEPREHLEVAADYANMPSLLDPGKREVLTGVMSRVNHVLFMVYAVLNSLLLIAVIASVVLFFVLRKKQKGEKDGKNTALLLTLIFFMLLSFAYAFAVSWFSSAYLSPGGSMTWLTFYVVSLPAVLVFVFAAALVLLDREIRALQAGKKVV